MGGCWRPGRYTKTCPSPCPGSDGARSAVTGPIRATVRLPREGRRGRVVVRAHGGPLHRLRLEDGGEGRLLERLGCELSPVGEGR
jgi:hypothetical protein